MKRIQLMKIHALLAAFILPIAIMFLITGPLYTWGVKGSYSNEEYDVQLQEPLRADVVTLHSLAASELNRLGISEPEGSFKLKTYGEHFLLEWTGSSKDIILEPSANRQIAKLTVKHTSWYRNLVQLHKAKGGNAFKVYVVLFATSLLLLLISGFMLALQVPALKKATITSTAIGIVSFLIFVLVS